MTQKAFADKLIKVLDPNYDYPIFTFSDKHADGTKVLRIKMYRNYTGKSLEECTNILTNYLAGVAGIKRVIVREPVGGYSYAGLYFIIQVEYTGTLPDLDNPQPIKDSPKVETKSNPDGPGSIVTEFGIGYYENEADKAKMLLWLEGVKAGMAYVNAAKAVTYPESEVEAPDPEADFRAALNNLEVTSAAGWWSFAADVADNYDLDEEIKMDIMHEEFDSWFNNQ